MAENLTEIRKHIERTVTHVAREHGVMDEVVWKQMMVAVDDHYRNNQLKVTITDKDIELLCEEMRKHNKSHNS